MTAPQQPPPPQPDVQAALAGLVLTMAAIRASLTAKMGLFATARVREFKGWYDHGQITDFAAALAHSMEGFLRVLAQSTDAYLARVTSDISGSLVRPVGAVDVTALRAGVTHAGVYGRAADVYRFQQSRFDQVAGQILTGSDTPPVLVSPLDAAVQRVTDAANLDAQLAVQKQSQQFMASQNVVTGWRRVIHPELSKGGTCGLCVAASDRLYGKHEPMPIHARCECTTLPVIGHKDPGSLLNQDDLKGLYKRAGGAAAAKLVGTRYRVDVNGELGPVLTAAETPIRTPIQVLDDTAPVRPQKTPVDRAAMLQRILATQSKALPRVQGLAAADPAAWSGFADQLTARIGQLTQELASL